MLIPCGVYRNSKVMSRGILGVLLESQLNLLLWAELGVIQQYRWEVEVHLLVVVVRVLTPDF